MEPYKLSEYRNVQSDGPAVYFVLQSEAPIHEHVNNDNKNKYLSHIMYIGASGGNYIKDRISKHSISFENPDDTRVNTPDNFAGCAIENGLQIENLYVVAFFSKNAKDDLKKQFDWYKSEMGGKLPPCNKQDRGTKNKLKTKKIL